MFKIEYAKEINGQRRILDRTVYTRRVEDLPGFLRNGADLVVTDVEDDELPFVLRYTVEKTGYAVLPSPREDEEAFQMPTLPAAARMPVYAS